MRISAKPKLKRLDVFQRACEEQSAGLGLGLCARQPQPHETLHALRARGEAYAGRSEWALALAAFNAALRAQAASHPPVDVAVVHELKAQALLALGNDFEAARAATDASRCDGGYAPAFQTLGRALRNTGELALALRALETAEALFAAQQHADAAEVASELEEGEALLVRSFVLLAEHNRSIPEDVDEAVRAWRAQLQRGDAGGARASMETG